MYAAVPKAADLLLYLISEIPAAFPEWVKFLNSSPTPSHALRFQRRSNPPAVLNLAAYKSLVFRDAVWTRLVRGIIPEAEDSLQNVPLRRNVPLFTIGTVSRTACGGRSLCPARHEALIAFRLGIDVAMCFMSDNPGWRTCCRLGCTHDMRRKPKEVPECFYHLKMNSLVHIRRPGCLGARTLQFIFPSIASWHKHSQAHQDAVITFLFGHLGVTNQFFVEIGFNQWDWHENSTGSNTKILHEAGWQGLMLDDTQDNPAIALHRHIVTMENVAAILEAYDVPREPDYVSIDIDGCDLWVFLGLTQKYFPRVVSIEYNANWGLDGEEFTVDCVSRPHERFQCLPSRLGSGTYENFCGASLAAIAHAAKLRGYSIVFVEPILDAFLVRNDLICDGEIPELGSFKDKVKLRVHSPPVDMTRPGKWLIDFKEVANHFT